MRFTLASAALATIVAATSVSAQQNIQVQVGSNGLTFTPNTVNASVGDTVSFVFFPKNHTVTQSSFAAPCQPLASGIDSGFQPVAAGATVPSFSVTVNATTPLWFYCRQSGHCQAGMVFAINPTANSSFETFQATARASSADGTPPASSSASGSGSGTSPSLTGSGVSSSSTPSPNSAISTSAQAGGLLAALGLVAGVLL